jgi:hypothetical protein
MNVSVFSLYWDNVDDQIVWNQKRVMDMHGVHVQQHKIHNFDHGEWMDWVMNKEVGDAVLFMDIDCIMLDKDKALDWVSKAGNGTLVGNIQATNHMGKEIASKTFAAPSFLAVNKIMYKTLGSPSFKAGPYGDVAQALTDTWRWRGVPVELIPVTGFEIAEWDLPGKPQSYGVGTTFDNCIYHLFKSREQENIERFVRKCNGVVDERP